MIDRGGGVGVVGEWRVLSEKVAPFAMKLATLGRWSLPRGRSNAIGSSSGKVLWQYYKAFVERPLKGGPLYS